MKDINISVQDEGGATEVNISSRRGYVLLSLEGETINVSGKVDLKSLAPMLMKYAMSKFTNIGL